MFRWGTRGQSAPAAPAVRPEQRAVRRCRLQVRPPARWSVRSRFREMHGYVHDIATSAVGLLAGTAVPVGTRRALDWTYGPETAHRTVLAQVVRVVPQRDGVWLLGCRFDAPVPWDAMEGLLRAGAALPW